uniref:Uncharacterized protein n=1 Tax=Oryza brachyantha TaxID=4533 RepID=J3KY99_ORYBR
MCRNRPRYEFSSDEIKDHGNSEARTRATAPDPSLYRPKHQRRGALAHASCHVPTSPFGCLRPPDVLSGPGTTSLQGLFFFDQESTRALNRLYYLKTKEGASLSIL